MEDFFIFLQFNSKMSGIIINGYGEEPNLKTVFKLNDRLNITFFIDII